MSKEKHCIQRGKYPPPPISSGTGDGSASLVWGLADRTTRHTYLAGRFTMINKVVPLG